MKLKVKDMDIATGGVLIAILNEEDAKGLDLHTLDRIKLKKKGQIETVILDIAESEKAVPRGYIGVFEEVIDSLNLKDGDRIDIMPARKPLSLEYIKNKLDGKKLSKKEINQIVWDIVHNKLDDIELTYFVAAVYAHELDMQETVNLTKAMAEHGDILKLNKRPVMDKHCVGGVAGNRTTMIVVPIVAAAGLTIPKTSSRSITSPAGTADTMEVLANVSLSFAKMKKVVNNNNGCIIWGGALNLAPADDRIIRVEKPLSIDAKSNLLSSVMAKKASVSATHLLVDIPAGPGSKVVDIEKAKQLKKDFLAIGKKLGMKVKVIITDGSQPIGNGIGPALEAKDVLYVLNNDPRAPKDLRKKSLMMAGLMLEMGEKAKKGNGHQKAKDILESGKAYDKMINIIKDQGGKIIKPDEIKVGKFSYDYKAGKTGVVKSISSVSISKIARVAGAPDDKGAGVFLFKHVDDKVKKGEAVMRIYAQNKVELGFAKDVLKKFDGVIIK